MVIAIDGYSSCGKSTLARELAQKLNFLYIDSGAMYRAVAYYMLRHGIDLTQDSLCPQLPNLEIAFNWNADSSENQIWLNGQNVEREIRTIEVASVVSEVAAMSCVRAYLLDQQRAFAKSTSVVMDGRDIGTVVFPDAEVKLFVTADFKTRVQRRFDELRQRGDTVSLGQVEENLKKRDYIDSQREVAPLRQADDAIVLDNTLLDKEQQIAEALKIVQPYL